MPGGQRLHLLSETAATPKREDFGVPFSVDTKQKLEILAAAAKYDASCASSAAKRKYPMPDKNRARNAKARASQLEKAAS